MNTRMILSAIASFGIVALSGLPAFARDAVLRANLGNSRVNLRSTPSVNAPARRSELSGSRVRIINQRTGANRSLWYYVQSYQSNAEGWVEEANTQSTGAGGGGSRGESTETDRNSRYLVNQYEVRVFPAGGQTRMNVFDRRTNRAVLTSAPVSVRRSTDGVTYEGRNVVLFIHNNNVERTITLY